MGMGHLHYPEDILILVRLSRSFSLSNGFCCLGFYPLSPFVQNVCWKKGFHHAGRERCTLIS